MRVSGERKNTTALPRSVPCYVCTGGAMKLTRYRDHHTHELLATVYVCGACRSQCGVANHAALVARKASVPVVASSLENSQT